ncbi:MAG TPA: TonB-dependent receptor [Vicinamibacteria bacterium]|nr:TonB-dependent receptor [Vicinamibacteria bacterium]
MLRAFWICALVANQAQDASQKKSEEEKPTLSYEEVVVVTAAATEQPILDAVALVSALTEEDVVRSPALVIDEQLRRVPGFNLFRRSSSLYSHPTTQGVSLRGIGSSGASRSLVLWNGIPFNDPFGNWIYFNRLPTLSLRTAEVARGATSQLYGSSALGGTIQLLPRTPAERTFDLRLQAGNLDTYDLDVFTSDRSGDWAWLASGRVFDTEGYIQVREEERGPVDIPTNAAFQSFVGRLEYRDFHAGVNLFNEKRSNGTPIQQNDSQIFLVETGYDAERWSFNFYGQGQELNSDFSRILPDRSQEFQTAEQHFPSTGFGASFTMRSVTGLQYGIDWRRASWDVNRQNFVGAFAQYLFAPDPRLDVLLGGRFDLWENRTTQGTFNPRAGVVYRASNFATVRASAYRGFRAPSLNELYRPFQLGNIVTDANPDLTEEYLWGFEGGVDVHPSRLLLLRFNAFYNSLQDPVANVTLGIANGQILRQRQNLGSATIQGLEAEVSYRVADPWQIRGAYLFSDAVVDETGLAIPQVPRHQATFGVFYDGPFQFTADVRVTGEAWDDDRNELLLPAYGVLDLSTRIPLSRRLDLYVAVENVTDTEYVVRLTPLENLGTPRLVHGGIEIRLFR